MHWHEHHEHGEPGEEGEQRGWHRRRGRPRSDQSHDAVLRAAAHLLHHWGQGAMSIEGIAAAAGVGKQTIYRWWSSKAAIFLELYIHEAASLTVPPPTGALRDDLVAVMEVICRFWRETPGGRAFRILVAEAQSEGEAQDVLNERILPVTRGLLCTALERAAGGARLPNTEAVALVDLLHGYCCQSILSGKAPSTDEMRAVVDLALNGAVKR